MTIIVLWILLGIIALIVILLHFSVTVEISGSTEGNFKFKVKYMFFTIYPRTPRKSKNRKAKKKTVPQKSEAVEQDLFEDSLDDEFENPVQCTDDEALSAEEQQKKADELLAEINKAKSLSENETTIKAEQVKTEIQKVKPPKAEKKKEKSSKAKGKKSGSTLDDLKEKYKLIEPYIPMGWKYFKKLLKAVRILKIKINLTAGKEDAYECAMFYGKIQAALFNILGEISGIFTVKIKEANVNCVFNENRFDAEGQAKICVRPSTMIAIAFCLLISFLCKFLPKFISEKRKRKAKKKQLQKNTNSLEKAV